MKKEKRFFLLFIILIVSALFGALIWVWVDADSINPRAGTPAENTGEKLLATPVEVPTLKDTVVNSKDTTRSSHIELHYPTVLLAQHPELAKDANAVIAAFASDTISTFNKDVDDTDSPNIPAGFESDLTVRYSALLLSPTVISIRFDESEYITGSAHPNNQSRILNYDMERHLLLQTKDLFASSTKALPLLANYTREKLKIILADRAQRQLEGEALPGSEPTTENFSSVGITKQGLLVVFNPCQVAPCARGSIQVPIPLSDLAENISPRVKEAITLAENNIVEATIETSSTPNTER